MLFALAWGALLLAAIALRPRAAWPFPAAGLATLVLFREEPPALRLLASSLFFLYMVKAAALARLPALQIQPLDRLLYATVWPGLDPERLAARSDPEPGTGHRFGMGLIGALSGLGGVFLLAVFYERLPKAAVGWLGLAAILTTVHLGLSECLTALVRLTRRPVGGLFDRPLASKNLSDFWTRRWNLAFVEMNRRLVLPPLKKRLGLKGAVLGAFLVSGALHEMAISYPAGGGWGGPMLYFLVQGLAVLAERRLKIRSRALTWAVVLLPLPLLFHAPFRDGLVVPLFAALHRLWLLRPLDWYVSALLWALGAFQLAVLGASFQVPKRLNWAEELPRLSPFNRKLMFVYGLFVVVTIVAFGLLTLLLHRSFLRGEPAAIGLALFIALYWWLRLIVDAVVYDTRDWPPGEDLQVGHALLNALFVFLALGYSAVALWGLLAPAA